jgi:hypothetical protein
MIFEEKKRVFTKKFKKALDKYVGFYVENAKKPNLQKHKLAIANSKEFRKHLDEYIDFYATEERDYWLERQRNSQLPPMCNNPAKDVSSVFLSRQAFDPKNYITGINGLVLLDDENKHIKLKIYCNTSYYDADNNKSYYDAAVFNLDLNDIFSNAFLKKITAKDAKYLTNFIETLKSTIFKSQQNEEGETND